MQDLLDCAIYEKYNGQKDTTLLIKVINFLEELNENSVYYNRLTMEVLLTKSKCW
jgi:hypothetical protein